MEEFKDSLPERVNRALECYKVDKHFEAARILKALEAEAMKIDEATGPNSKAARELLEAEFKKYPQIPLIRQIESEVLTTLDMIESDKDWRISYNGNNVKVYYYQEPGSELLTLKVEGDLIAPVLNLTALLNEIDLFPSLFWFMKSQNTIAEVSRLRKAFQVTVSLVWPLHDREVPLVGYGIDGMDEEKPLFMIISRQLNENDVMENGQKIKIPEPPKGTVRMSVPMIGWSFHPIEPTVTKVKLVAKVDLKVPLMPVALINWTSKTFARWSLSVLETKARNFDNLPHKQRMAEPGKKEVYDWIQSRLEEFWEKEGKLNTFLDGELHEDVNRKQSEEFIGKDGKPPGPDKKVVMQLMK